MRGKVKFLWAMMRFGWGVVLSLVPAMGAKGALADEAELAREFYSLKARCVRGEEVSFEKFRGKVLLIVNTASRCGFTPQYKELEGLYEKYRDRGFEVLAFPSNDFAEQEPGTNEEILAFCETKFGVQFPVFEKNSVTGSGQQGVFEFLTKKANSKFEGEVLWNFEKFLVGRDGLLRARFGSVTNPKSGVLIDKLEELLNEPTT